MNQYANSLLNQRDDDSFLKQSIQVVFGAGLLYMGFQGLRFVGNRNAEQRQAQSVEQKALSTSTNSAALLAVNLRDALSVSVMGNTDEETIFRIFNQSIATAEFLQDVSIAYNKLTRGRNLLSDLYNNMDGVLEPWKPDWETLNKRIQIIQRTHRK